ncbi:1,4-alpha-glucan branching protein GlgB [Parendozoicomonas haliclonae]|uniref:1,4-alpha-glucan branching enzyme GlgB n=1 Tax=Parendozoicomonas haliclonae TaxID=1960125 RepID=A0A1X7AKL5_9GAMM|nr:1,4-alpha-glucan branching protein GlgB [Parendozoicomonas haliclonae]SMA44043.1 1,4-alpha-glucan branching enzyme GlgB [Parendozoicomonas haliclonae]
MSPVPDVSIATSNLNSVMLSDPFSSIGLHVPNSGKGLVLRVWQPDAESVEAILQPQNKSLGMLKAVADGMFELAMPRRKKPFNYSLKVIDKSGHAYEYFDPYQFGEYVLCQNDIEPHRLYQHLGALPLEHALNNKVSVKGTLFKVYAPHARSVSVIGDFNSWDGRRHPMASSDDGIWRLFVPGIENNALYKFEIHDQQGKLLPAKADPFGRKHEQWPGLASIVQADSSFVWSDSDWLASRETNKQKPMSVYELHAGSWKKNDQGEYLGYRDLADTLIPYIKELGFTHIELLPVSEHPLFESWGYQPVGLFAPTSRYGSPDDFKYLVDQCHKNNIGVIVDWVPAHFPADDHGLYRFDGTAIYEYEDTRRGWHPDWKSWVYNYGSPWVQDFLISSALFWLDEFHVDGLRVDAVASMLYLDYSRKYGEWAPNVHGGNEHLEAVELLKRLNTEVHHHFPGCMTIAEESTSWPGVSRPVNHQGLGFDYKWNMGWMHDSLAYMKHDPVHRKYHHNEITFSMVYAYNEDFILPLSHDEVVHGKGTLLTRMPGDDWQRFANLRAYLGFMFGHPGKKLLFMGAELGTHKEWNLAQPLDWELLNNPLNAGIQTLVKDLNGIYQSHPALYELEYDRQGFKWMILDDHDQSVLAFCRMDKEGRPVLVISNMTPAVRHNYHIGAPWAGQWQEILNTDAAAYSGSNIINPQLETHPEELHGEQQSLVVSLPPLATIMLTPSV